ncbi:MAG3240 family lipoprotein [Mycoplasmopsis opalescens]|uniref:MAG3240 family lipoprotein n=1 Tax=Mycoplasmopsis opalescens TaxID=114886 RepID=UPI0004A6FD09|nr:hypothetical protein [Mycoplasmopsis opalescens]
MNKKSQIIKIASLLSSMILPTSIAISCSNNNPYKPTDENNKSIPLIDKLNLSEEEIGNINFSQLKFLLIEKIQATTIKIKSNDIFFKVKNNSYSLQNSVPNINVKQIIENENKDKELDQNSFSTGFLSAKRFLIDKSIPVVDQTRFASFKKSLFLQNQYKKAITFYLKSFNKNNEQYEIKNIDFDLDNDKEITINIVVFDSSTDKNQNIVLKIKKNDFTDGDKYLYKNIEIKGDKDQRLNFEDNDAIHLNDLFADLNLNLKTNIFKASEFDNLMHPRVEWLIFNLNGFLSLLQYNTDLFYLTTKSKDYSFRIISWKPTKLLWNSYSIAVLDVEVKDKNGEIIGTFPWYSVDFTIHNHIFEHGFYEDKKLKNPKLFNYKKMNDKCQTPEIVDPDDFYQTNLIDIINFIIHAYRNDLTFWGNKKMEQVDITTMHQNKKLFEKNLENALNQFILLYNVSKPYSTNKNTCLNDIDHEKNVIKRVKVKILNDELKNQINIGKFDLKIDFIDSEGKSMLSKENSEKIILVGGLVGFDNAKIIEKQKELKSINFDYGTEIDNGKTLPYSEFLQK